MDYRCNLVKRRAKLQCASAVQLLYNANDNSISLYVTKAAHTHEIINEEVGEKQGIPEHTKKSIYKLINQGISSAKSITDNLLIEKRSDPDIIIPTYLQINNFKNNNILKSSLVLNRL